MMDQETIVIIAAFISITSLTLTVIGIGWWLLAPRSDFQGGPAPRVKLRIRHHDDRPGWAGDFNRWVTRFALDLGWEDNPLGPFAIWLAAGILGGALMLVVTDDERLAGLAALATWAVVWGAAMVHAGRRRQQVLDALPTATEMLARGVRAGESLERALADVAVKTNGPLGITLRRCARQVDLGLPIFAALGELDERHRLVDVRLLISALSVHRETGGDLPRTLDRLAATVRQRLAFRKELWSSTSAARLSGAIVALAGPCALAYFLLHKGYADNLLTSEKGQYVVAASLGLEVVGILWLVGLSRQEY